MQIMDWDGTVQWEYRYADSSRQSHHDMVMMPNGNILMIAWELKSFQEAVDAGRDSTLMPARELWPDHIVEVRPVGSDSGEIVWEWHVWDHLIQDHDSTKSNYGVVADHPELININFIGLESTPAADWNHLNSIDYNPDLDQIVVSSREFDEIWIIDHGTTTAEAAGHSGGLRGRGGDLLYRWGNPYAYNRGTDLNHVFFGQHNIHWIADSLPGGGDLIAFNNGLGRTGGNYSSIDQFAAAFDTVNGNYPLEADSTYGPAALSWSYNGIPTDSFFSPYISGATRMPNGNTLICSGWNGTFFEVTSGDDLVWKYINPVIPDGPMNQGDSVPGIGYLDGKQNMVFRIYRYAPNYQGLSGRDLTPKGPIEIYPGGITGKPPSSSRALPVLYQNAPNPFNDLTRIKYSLPASGKVKLTIYNMLGQSVRTLCNDHKEPGVYEINWDGRDDIGRPVAKGIMFYRLEAGGGAVIRKMILLD